MGLFSKPGLTMQAMVIGLVTWIFPHPGAVAKAEHLEGAGIATIPSSASRAEGFRVSLNTFLSGQNKGNKLQVLENSSGDSSVLVCECSLVELRDNEFLLSQPLASISEGVALDQETSEGDVEEDADSSNEPSNYGDGGKTAIDDELGILRVRSQPVGIDSELGVLRVRPTEDVPLEVEPEPTRQTTVFLTGRSNVYGGNNLFRTPNPIDDRIYQAGLGIFAFPRLGAKTNLILSAEANIARYEDLSVVDYNEVQLQAGIRHRLGRRSYGQLNWRYQDLSTPGSDSFFSANYAELLLSRRDILNNRTWLDAYYQARLSISDPEEFSRVSQIATGSINYGFDPSTRASLIYQLFLDDYTQTSRYDTYHQVLAQFSHDLSDTTRVSLFTGVRFGRSSRSNVNFDDTIYGASVNINLPLF